MNSEIKLISLEKDQWDKEVIKSTVPVIVDFYADWCGPCKVLFPKLKDAFELHKTFKLVKVNIDNHEELAETLEISSIPAVFLYKNGVVVKTFLGNNEQELAAMLALAK